MRKLTLLLFLLTTSSLTQANIIRDVIQIFGLPEVVGTEYYNYSFDEDLRTERSVVINGQKIKIRSRNPKVRYQNIGKCITVRKTYYSEGPSKLSYVGPCRK